MKKLSLYVFLVLMFCNVGFADALGVDTKRVDLNFSCKLLLPENELAEIPVYFRTERFGFKEYENPIESEIKKILLALGKIYQENEYTLPESTVVKLGSDENFKEMYMWFFLMPDRNALVEKIFYELHDGRFMLIHKWYSITEKESENMLNEFTLVYHPDNSDDQTVLSLSIFSKTMANAVKKKRNNGAQLELTYSCKKI